MSNATTTPNILSAYDITVTDIIRNATPALLYEEALRFERGSAISSTGALICDSRPKTGRSPKDKRIVQDPASDKDIWWGEVNIPLETNTFFTNRERCIDYLNTRQRLFVVDGFAGADLQYRLKVRIVCTRAYHALFMHNMLLRPTDEELLSFGEPDFVVFNAGQFPANRYTAQMTSKTSIDLSLERKEMLILGTEYAGEMKKGVFTVMHYLMPKQGILSMHCSANEGDSGDVALFFGLSGTGKTTLSADKKRKLIGDDEHCWTPNGVFNIEGGCYAKCIDLTASSEPEIFNAIRFGSVLENVVFDSQSRLVDYSDSSITENTRCAYPIEYIENAKIPGVGGHPRNIIFLSCDAFGVLPPVSRLTPEQAMYHFISGYTSKLAGTEVGIKEPSATFSACFGAAFIVWHPIVYAHLLAEKMRTHETNVWLVNTGWVGGSAGVGHRIKLSHTRALIEGIHDGSLAETKMDKDPIFGFMVPSQFHGLGAETLVPEKSWQDKTAFNAAAQKLVRLFDDNFSKYRDGCSEEVQTAGPRI